MDITSERRYNNGGHNQPLQYSAKQNLCPLLKNFFTLRTTTADVL